VRMRSKKLRMPDLDLIKQVEQERGTSQEFGGGPDRCCFAANTIVVVLLQITAKTANAIRGAGWRAEVKPVPCDRAVGAVGGNVLKSRETLAVGRLSCL
jgi:hypothetical protein